MKNLSNIIIDDIRIDKKDTSYYIKKKKICKNYNKYINYYIIRKRLIILRKQD